MIKKFIIAMLFSTVYAYSVETISFSSGETIELQGKTAKQYKFSVTPRESETEAKLMIKSADSKPLEVPVVINADGSLQVLTTKEEQFALTGGYGEKTELILTVDDKKIAKGSLVLFPLTAKNARGNTIELTVLDEMGYNFLMEGSGFAPNEKVMMVSRSGHESMKSFFEVDNRGTFKLMYAPAVIDKTEGPFEVTLTSQAGHSVSLKHYWGKLAFTNPNAYSSLQLLYPLPENGPVIFMRK